MTVDALSDASGPSRRNGGDAAPGLHVVADEVGVAAAVAEKDLRRRPVRLHQGCMPAAVGNSAAGDLDGDGRARAIRPEMDLGREAASRAAKTMVLHPPLPCGAMVGAGDGAVYHLQAVQGVATVIQGFEQKLPKAVPLR